ncbi:hypothetical protein HY490_02270 [Candidatus Woesearchaeota archaeon]|nr:hypothetical protein [Candidatus Woesearchaeota archaeon]
MLFGRKNDVLKPDVEALSDIFTIHSGDVVLSSQVSYHDAMLVPQYCDGESLLSSIPNLQEIVVGGFHRSDCVQRLADAGRKCGVKSSVDDLLTDHFFMLMRQLLDYDLDAHLIRTGFLDPEMHEDDPEEMKRLFGGERLHRYVAGLGW